MDDDSAPIDSSDPAPDASATGEMLDADLGEAPAPQISDPTPPILSYRSAPILNRGAVSPNTLVTLRRMDAMEAQLARMKLESEGIRCFVAGQLLSATHPLLFNDVRLQVAEGDASEAEEILNQPVEHDPKGEYADEDWRCPKCHRKPVELVPLTKTQRRLRSLYLVILASPIVLAIIDAVFSGPASGKGLSDWPPAVWLIWLLIAAVLTFLVLTAKRHKRCRECWHEWC